MSDVTTVDLTVARDRCLTCIYVVQKIRVAVEAAWGLSGLCEMQYRYIAAAATKKYGWLDGSRERRPGDPLKKPRIIWLTPDDTSLSNNGVLAVWEKLESEFIGPLKDFANRLIGIFEAAGKVYESAREQYAIPVSDAIIQATYARTKPVEISGMVFTTYHEAALRAALEVLKFSGVWHSFETLWPEGEDYLRKTLEKYWNQQFGDGPEQYLKQFLFFQGRMMNLEKVEWDRFDTVVVEREIMYESAKALDRLESRVEEKPTGFIADIKADNEKIFLNSVPQNPDVRDLCFAILAERKKPSAERRKKRQIARDLLKVDDAKADNLVRQTLRFIGK